MTAFIIIYIVNILSIMYIDRLVKYKFRDEKTSIRKIIHIIAYITVFSPLIVVAFLVSDGNLIEIGILFMSILLYFGYKKYTKRKY